MSLKSKDISYSVISAIYSALGGDTGFVYLRKDTITLTGTGGTATIVNNAISKVATYHTSPTVTASEFVTNNVAAYLASGVILTSSGAILSFVSTIAGVAFTGATTITNLTTNLSGVVANANTNYPIYKSIPKNPAQIYIRIGEVIESEDGTKDDFVYHGSVPVIICDESQINQADKKKAQGILNLVRGILKPTKTSVPSGFIEFAHEGKTEYVDLDDMDKPKIRVVDVYSFIHEGSDDVVIILNPPTLFSATVISDTQIDLAWTNNALGQAVVIERSLNGNNFVEIFRTSAGAVTYSDTGLTAGTRYYYRIRAFSGGDYSAYTSVEDAIMWIPPNFLTTNFASDNVIALNDALTNYKSVYIATPGVYEIDGTIWIPSNANLVFSAGCTIKKATGSDFSFMFANTGILTYSRNQNITIKGNGLIVDQNGIDTRTQGVPYHMVGLMNFFHVDNLILDGFNHTNGGPLQFFGHLGDITNFVIRNMNIETEKAAFQFQGKCFDGLLEDIITDAYDDALALNAIDYPIVMGSVGNIERITIRRWTDNQIINPYFANSCRIQPGSWSDWVTGTTYNLNDLCVNNGNIYIKSSATAQTSSVAPTHLNGKITGADSIEWWWLQTGIETEACVKDITYEDIHINTRRYCVALLTENSVNMRSVFPGTQGNGYVDNIIFDNIYYNPLSAGASLFYSKGFTKKVSIKNSIINPVNNCNLIDAVAAIDGTYDGFIDVVEIDNCDITLNASSYVFTKTNASAGEIVNISNTTINLNNSTLLNFVQAAAERLATFTFDNVIINGAVRLTEFNNCNSMAWIANNCQFLNVWNLLLRNTVSGSGITFTSNGCTYTTPGGTYLFDNQADTKLSINITNSIGDVAQSKISANSIVIVACDLIHHIYAIGEVCFGGRVIYINNNKVGGIIVSDNDLSNAIWGCSGTNILNTDGHVGFGQHDTDLVLVGCVTAGIAARLCDEYNDGIYSDWYLPANDEMSLCYTFRAVLGAFQNASYNTARNITATNCYVVNPITGVAANGLKTTSRPVRPFRSFTVPD